MYSVYRTKGEENGVPDVIAVITEPSQEFGHTLVGGRMACRRMLTFGSNAPFIPANWIRLEQTGEHCVSGKCIECGDPIDIITKRFGITTLVLRRSCACLRLFRPGVAQRAIFRSSADFIF